MPSESRVTFGAGVLLSLLALSVYTYTLYPSVAGGDSGELVTVAHTLGIAHPPGYPLYTLVGKLFTAIPFGSIAWRMNLFSAVCNAAATFFLFLAVGRWGGGIAAVTCAGMFAFSPLVWRYSVAAEVFGLNNLFCAASLYLMIRYAQEKQKHIAFLAFLVGGLGLSHHPLFLFFVFPFLGTIGYLGRAGLNFWKLAAVFMIGLSPYLYLPIVAHLHPAIAWGDLTTVSGFLTHVLRIEYGTFQLNPVSSSGPADIGVRLMDYGRDLLRQSLYVGAALAGVGLLCRPPERCREVRKSVLFAFVGYIVVFHSLANLDLDSALDRGVQARFWQQPNLLVFVFAGLGLEKVLENIPASLRVAKYAIAVTLVWLQFFVNFRNENRRDSWAFRDYAMTLLAPLPKNALLLVRGDLAWNTARYLQSSEGIRTDVRLVHWNLLRAPWLKSQLTRHQPDVSLPGEFLSPFPPRGFTLKSFIDANIDRMPFFICDENPKTSDNPRFETGYTRWAWGFTEVILGDRQKMHMQRWLGENEKILSAFDPATVKNYGAENWEMVLFVFFLKSHLEVIERAMLEAETTRSPQWYRYTARLIEKFIKNYGSLYPDALSALHKNLGLVYWKLTKIDPTARRNAVNAWQTFVDQSPPHYPEADNVAKLLRNPERWRMKKD